VTAANSTVAPGTPVQFSATGTLSSDSTQDLTFSASWSSLVPSVATVAGGGLATGLGEARGLRRVWMRGSATLTVMAVVAPVLTGRLNNACVADTATPPGW